MREDLGAPAALARRPRLRGCYPEARFARVLQSAPRTAALAAALIVPFALAGCGGDIVFGTARSDSGMGLSDSGPPDAGLPEAGPPDTGPPDTGPPDTGPDVGPRDVGPMDAEPPDACVPSLPAAWPWARDEATYRTKFWDWASVVPPQGGVACSTNACHGMTSADKLLIPATAALVATDYNAAIDALWEDILPKMQSTGIVDSAILWNHRATDNNMGLGTEPIYSDLQMMQMQMLVDSAKTPCN